MNTTNNNAVQTLISDAITSLTLAISIRRACGISEGSILETESAAQTVETEFENLEIERLVSEALAKII